MTPEQREEAIRKLAIEQCDEDHQVDDDAVVSEGDDNGAYVQCWMWVSFAGTDLDKGGDDPN